MFNGVQESFDTAVKPFVENLAENVSAHLAVLNLGWIVAHEDFGRAASDAFRRSCSARSGRPRRAPTRWPSSCSASRPSTWGRSRRARGPPQERRRTPRPPSPARYLDAQLDTLRRMSDGMRGASYRDNLDYIAYRTLHLMSSRPIADFGDSRIFKESELQAMLDQRGR